MLHLFAYGPHPKNSGTVDRYSISMNEALKFDFDYDQRRLIKTDIYCIEYATKSASMYYLSDIYSGLELGYPIRH